MTGKQRGGGGDRQGRPGRSRRQVRLAPQGRGRRLRRQQQAPARGPRPDAQGRGAHQAPGRPQGGGLGAPGRARRRQPGRRAPGRSTAAAGPRGPARAPAAATRPRRSSAATRSSRRCGPRCRRRRCTSRWAIDADERVTEAVAMAGKAHLPILEVSRAELDRMTGRALHQGLALQVPPYDLPAPRRPARAGAGRARAADRRARRRHRPAQPRRGRALGGGLRRAGRARPRAAVGGHDRRGLADVRRCGRAAAGRPLHQPGAHPEGLPRRRPVRRGPRGGRRRSRSTTSSWRPSRSCVVVGSEGEGLGRLVEQTCDLTVSIPMADGNESLNAGIAAAVTLAEVARRRRSQRLTPGTRAL